MRIVKGLSRIELVVVLAFIAVAGYLVLPRFVSFEPEVYEQHWEDTVQKAEHVAETLSNKQTYDRIEEEMGKSKD
ncbi:pilus assembly FimT family protein [Vibrio rotiferianus]|uniref:pilus assembly FimT family protein n=1 Tax=Vibrio rotiferianus TaxID=190895 RepID=UPI00406A87A2